MVVAVWALSLVLLVCPGQLSAAEPPRVSASSVLVMEWSTGTVLYERNAHTRRHPASLTKIMTALIALERGYLGDVVKVSEAAAYEAGSAMGLVPGARYTLEDLLYGAMLPSGNDACVAIAEHLGGSVENFVKMMNQRALELGAHDTHFCNPHGLTEEGHYSTAYDLAVITRYAMRLPAFRRIVSTPEYDAWRLDKLLPHSVSSTNRLLWSYAGTEGVKTGTTAAAGECLIAAASRDGVRYITVVMDSLDRWEDTTRLLSWAFEQFTLVRSGKETMNLGSCPVVRGMKPQVPAVALMPDGWLVPRSAPGDSPGIELKVMLNQAVAAPVLKGEEIGKLVVLSPTDVVEVCPVYAAQNVREKCLSNMIMEAARRLFTLMAKAKLG